MANKTGVTIENFDEVKKQIIGRTSGFVANSPKMRAKLFEIGNLVKNMAQDNLTAKGIVASGNLRSRMAFTIEGNKDIQRVLIGPFGVKYARMVEEGGAFTDRMRKAMFASFNERGLPRKPGKGIIAGGVYKGRPYMAPAMRDAREKINSLLRDILDQ